MPIRNRIAEMQPEIAAWRRHLHETPELLFDVHQTAAFVAEKLREFGIDEVTEGIGRTGVVGVIRGRSAGSGRTVGLRADMDALPITEATGAPHASKVPGLMHACGHDGHTAMLLGAARYLAETRNFDGTVVVIFQPAEEGGGGGLEMVEDGLMDRWGIDEVYGMHNWPGRPVGSFGIRAGAFLAATDNLEIRVTGKGGHAARPNLAQDPIVAASQIVTAVQSVVSRNASPDAQMVVSLTSIESSSKAFNVIPQAVTLRGTVRTLTEEDRDLAEDRIRGIVSGVAAAMGCTAEIDYNRSYPVMANHEAETDHARAAARAVAGEVDEAPVFMGGEDFAYMLNARPGAFIMIGNGDTAGLHHPEYDFDDDAIPAGVSYWAEIAESRLPVSS